MENTTTLEVRRLEKSYGGTQALQGVDLDVHRGECVALVGENGAGKSTLVRIVSGEVAADSGSVSIAGSPLRHVSPAAASQLGVAVIHQELSFVGEMSVAENLFLARFPRRGPLRLFVDRSRLHPLARAALADVAPHIDPARRMEELRFADRQLVEIARAISSGAALILMDEPTSALNADEVEHLFEIIRRLKARDVGVLYISHRLDEVARVADSIIILRDGRRVAGHATGTVPREQLVREIVGNDVRATVGDGGHIQIDEGDVRLEIRDVGVPGSLAPVNLSLHAGQIVGLYGLAGSGVELVGQAIFGGIDASGEIVVGGKRLRRRRPAACRKAGLAFVPSDRRSDGLFPLLSVATNVALAEFGARGALSRASRRHEDGLARPWMDAVDIRPRDTTVPAGALSGGNQQKSIIARWLVTHPQAFVLDEPTKGIDVGARAQVYELIRKLARDGLALLVISAELPELLGLCSHIGVISRGRLTEVYKTDSVDEATILDIAIGGHQAA